MNRRKPPCAMRKEPTAEDWAGYLTEVMALIDKHGHACQGVFATEPGEIEFVYTVGLTARCGVEFMIAGLPIRMAAGMLNDFANYVTDAYTPVDGEMVEKVANVPFMLRPMAADVQVGIARSLYPAVEVWQLVWPDADGLYPPEGVAGPPQMVAGSHILES